MDAYFPAGTQIEEYRDGLTVQEPGSDRALRYQRVSSSTNEAQKRDVDDSALVQDIIITGEVGTRTKVSFFKTHLQTLICHRDIRPGVSATLSDGFDHVMDLLVFAKNMYVYFFIASKLLS